MIRKIKDYLKKKGHCLPHQDIDLVKMHTQGSVTSIYPKVIFLVFAGEKNPRFVIKTVRVRDHNSTIEKGFQSLQNIHMLLENTESQNMFAQPIALDYLEGTALSVETAVVGTRPTQQDHNILVQSIIRLHVDIQKKEKKYAPMRRLLHDAMSVLSLGRREQEKLMQYWEGLSGREEQLAQFPQHGDLTQDNIFITENSIQIIDCERFGKICTAGFDLFHYLSRYIQKTQWQLLFKRYFEALGETTELSEKITFVYFLQGVSLKVHTKGTVYTATTIIDRFKTL